MILLFRLKIVIETIHLRQKTRDMGIPFMIIHAQLGSQEVVDYNRAGQKCRFHLGKARILEDPKPFEEDILLTKNQRKVVKKGRNLNNPSGKSCECILKMAGSYGGICH